MNETERSLEEASRASSSGTSPAGTAGNSCSNEAGNEPAPPNLDARPSMINLGVEGNEVSPGSVSLLISKVKEGDEESVRLLWNRYSDALVRSAQARLSKQTAAKVDSEELAQSVFFAIYKGAVEDKFERLDDRACFSYDIVLNQPLV